MKKWCDEIREKMMAGEIDYGWYGKPRLGDGKWGLKANRGENEKYGLADYESFGRSVGFAQSLRDRGLNHALALCQKYIYTREIKKEVRVKVKKEIRELPRTFWQKIWGSEPETEVVEKREEVPYETQVVHGHPQFSEDGEPLFEITFFYIMNNYSANDGRLNAYSEFGVIGLTKMQVHELKNIINNSPDLFFDIIKRLTVPNDVDPVGMSQYFRRKGATDLINHSPPMQYAEDEVYDENKRDSTLAIFTGGEICAGRSGEDYSIGGKLWKKETLPLRRRHLLEE